MQLLDGSFVDHVIEALSVTGLPGDALEIEITETVIQTGPATLIALQRLRTLGVGSLWMTLAPAIPHWPRWRSCPSPA